MAAKMALGAALALACCAGCVSVKVGTEPDESLVNVMGLVQGYVDADALGPYQGNIFTFGILSGGRQGELVHLDIWPVGGVGVGLLGARLRVVTLEAALGTLFYHPRPRTRAAPPDQLAPEPPPAPTACRGRRRSSAT